MMKTFCDHCEQEFTGRPGHHLVLVSQPVDAKPDTGLMASGPQDQKPLGVFCPACAAIMTGEAIRVTRSRVEASAAAAPADEDDGATLH